MATIPAFSWNQISSYSAFINQGGSGAQELELREKKPKQQNPNQITTPHTKLFTTEEGERSILQPTLQVSQYLR